MFEKTIYFKELINNGLNKFASKEYLDNVTPYQNIRVANLVIDDDEKRKKIKNYEDCSIVRESSKNVTRLFNGHLGLVSSVNLLDTIKKVDPQEYIFFRCRAIDAGGFEKTGNKEDLYGCNDNGDYFSVEELLKRTVIENNKEVHAFETFVGKQFFTNHKNDDVAEAKGIIVNAYYDLEDNCVYADVMFDALVNKSLARAIEQNYITDVSMGCAVEWSECSVCGNKAKNVNEYCDHIKGMKGRRLGSNKVYEINHDLKFIEISAVTDGAFKNCTIDKILSQDEMIENISRLSNEIKNSYTNTSIVNESSYQYLDNIHSIIKKANLYLKNKDNKVNFNKTSSMAEITKLKNGLDLIKEVSATMLGMDNIDFSFVGSLTKVLADLQGVLIDLASAGFGKADGGEGIQPGQIDDIVEDQENKGNQNSKDLFPAPQVPPEMTGEPGTSSKANIMNENEIPEIEDLTASLKNELNDSLTKISNMLKDIKIMSNKKDDKKIFSRQEYDIETGVYNIICTCGRYSMEYKETPKSGKIITAYRDKEKIQTKKIDDLKNSDINWLSHEPISYIESRLKLWKKNIEGEDMQKSPEELMKTSATDQVLGKQVEEMDGNFSHKRDTYVADIGILQGELDSIDAGPYTGPSEYYLEGKVQSGRTSNERINNNISDSRGITENQLATEKRRSNNDQSEITYGTGEDQFESRAKEYASHRDNPDGSEKDATILESKLDGSEVSNNRLNMAIMSITEEQLKNNRTEDSSEKSSNMAFSELITDNILKAFANTIINEKLTPTDIVDSCKYIISEPYIKQALVYETNFVKKSNNEKAMIAHNAHKIASSILEENKKHDLVSSHKQTNVKFASILSDALESLVKNSDKLKTVISSVVSERIKQISEVVSGKTIKQASSTQNIFDSILDKYVSSEKEEIGFTLSTSDFKGMVKASNMDQLKQQASVVLSNVLKAEKNIDISSEEIEIVSITGSGKHIINGVAKIDSKYASFEDDEEETITKVSQQAPSGMVGAADPNAQQAPPPQATDAQPTSTVSVPPPPEGDASGLGGDIFSDEDEEGGDDESGLDNAPSTPGERCPVCGGEDIESINTDEGTSYKCGNSSCKTQFSVDFNIRILDSPNLLDTQNQEDENNEEEVTEEPAQEEETPEMGAEQGQNPTASFTIHPKVMIVTSNLLEGNKKKTKIGDLVAPGHRCPCCASTNTYMENSKFACVDCGVKGNLKISKAKDNLVNVKLSWVIPDELKSISIKDPIAVKYMDRVRKSSSLLESRASKQIKNDMNSIMNELRKELVEDGYSQTDSYLLAKVIQASIAEEVQKINKEGSEMNKFRKVSQFEKEKDPIVENEEVIEEEDEDVEDIGLDNEIDETELGETDDAVEIEIEEEPDETEYVELGEEDDSSLEGESSEIDGITLNVCTENETATITISPDGDIDVTQESLDNELNEDETEESLTGAYEEDDFVDDEETDFDEEEELETEEHEEEETPEEEEWEHDNEEELEDEVDEEEVDEEDDEEEVDDEDDEDEDDDDEVDEDEDEDEKKVASNEMDILKKSSLMNSNSILARSNSFASTINFDKLSKMLNIDNDKVKKYSKQMESNKILNMAKVDMSNPNDIKRMMLKHAGAKDQTVPLDSHTGADGLDIPRDKSKGMKDVKTIKTKPGDAGRGKSEGLENDNVPRAKGNSGIDGWEKTKFNDEKADNMNDASWNKKFQPGIQSVKPNRKLASTDVTTQCLQKICKSHKINPKDVEIVDLSSGKDCKLVFANKDRVWTYGDFSKLGKSIEINKFKDISVKISSTGKVTKTAKSNYKFASTGIDATKIVSTAQNVPVQFLEYADFDDSFVVLDTRTNKSWKVRKAKNKK